MAAAAPAAISAVTSLFKLGLSALAAHTARLQGATNENQAVIQIVPAFDADIASIVNAYNSGTATQAEALAAVAAVDEQIFTYLRAQVGKPGTAWVSTGPWLGPSAAPGQLGPQIRFCDKTCTVGCCTYYNNFHASLYGGPYTGPFGLAQAIQAGGGTVIISAVGNGVYGFTPRPAYKVTLTPPSNVQSTILANVSSLLGQPSAIQLANLGTAAPSVGTVETVAAPASGVSPTLIIVGVVLIFGALLLALFER